MWAFNACHICSLRCGGSTITAGILDQSSTSMFSFFIEYYQNWKKKYETNFFFIVSEGISSASLRGWQACSSATADDPYDLKELIYSTVWEFIRFVDIRNELLTLFTILYLIFKRWSVKNWSWHERLCLTLRVQRVVPSVDVTETLGATGNSFEFWKFES